MDKICKTLYTILLFYIISSYTGSAENQQPEIRNPFTSNVSIRTETPVLELYIGGKSLEDFHKVEDDFKSLVLSIADAFCHYTLILSSDIHLSKENIHLDNFDRCPTDWPQPNTCVHSRLSVTFNVKPYQLSYDNLTKLWKDVEKNQKFKDLGLQSYEIPQSQKLLIIVLLVIIGILVILLAGAAYIMRKKIKEIVSRCCEGDDKGSPEGNVYNRTISSNSQNYDQQLVPTLFYPDVQSKKEQNILQSYNNINAKGIQNKGFTHENSDSSGNTSSTVPVEQIDDFDSDDDITINFPSPLTAPPLPPRPVKDDTPHSNKNIHYMVTPLTY